MTTGTNSRPREATPGRSLSARAGAMVLGVWIATAPLLSGCGKSPDNRGPATPTVTPGATQVSSASTTRGIIGSSFAFADRTSSSGIEFTYRNDDKSGHFAILESLGGGAALFDFDGDGCLDAFFPGGGRYSSDRTILGQKPGLFRGDGAWHFTNVTDSAAAARGDYYSHGAAVGDHNNDGFPDVLITGYGGLLLLENRGDGTFEDVAANSGLDDRLWSSSAAWGDFDGDGDLDLYVAHYVNWSFQNDPFCAGPKPGQREVCPPKSFEPLPHLLYINNGDGSFRDASREAGLRIDGPETGKGLGVLIADIDLDGDLDIYVANDTVPNFLYRNDGRGIFAEAGLMSGTSLSDGGTPDGSMGVDLGDYNLDGLPDLWVANFERETFALYRNEGKFLFQHVSQSTGVTALGGLYVGWGTVFSDFDNDGDEDIFVSNGHVIRYPVNAPLLQKALLLENQRGTRYVNSSAGAGAYFTADHMGRGAAAGDLDNDGRVDLAVSRTNQPVVVMANESREGNHWIAFRLVGTRSSRDPIGAVVSVSAGNGKQIRQVKGGSSYASTSDMRVFFGLGRSESVSEVEIRWLSGHKQRLTDLSADRFVTIIETD